jgi:hypothetical protein
VLCRHFGFEIEDTSHPHVAPVAIKSTAVAMLNYALGHVVEWGSGCIDPRFLDLGTSGGEWSVSRPGRFTPVTRWIGSRVGP